MEAPTPFSPEQSENEFNFELKKEVTTDKNKKYIFLFNTDQSSLLNIKAIESDTHKLYSNKFSIEIIKKNKYFYQFDNLKEICDEIRERVTKENLNIFEDTNIVTISIPLPSSKIKEIIF